MDSPGGLMLGFGCLILSVCFGVSMIISAMRRDKRGK